MTDSAPAATLEATLAGWENQLSALERQAAALLRTARRLRRTAQEGQVSGVDAAIGALQQDAAKLEDSLRQVAAPAVDVAGSFESGAYLAELSDQAKAANVTLVQRDGRITAYPFVLRLEPRAPGVRIGRRLERRIRPSFLVAQLKALQGRPNRFNPRNFLDRLLRAYVVLAPQWNARTGGEGPLVPLADLHEVLTLWPTAAADYPVEEFLLDLVRLDRQPDARTGRGHRFELGGSTGTKGAKRLSAFDETGAQHDFFAIRFIAG
jgi:hypothetical protein